MIRSYVELLRLDRPAGTFLLLWPTLSALWVAGSGAPPWQVLWLFVAGTLLMRSAGCAVNDIADRDVDLHVRRTATRPVTSGAVSVPQAWGVAAGLFAMAFCCALALGSGVVAWSGVALLAALVYPLGKRVLSVPQALLGLAFSLGIPMAFEACVGEVPGVAWLLVTANALWVIAYDTSYAMADREDDLRIGVRSSAITFGRFDVAAVVLLHCAFIALWWLAAQLLRIPQPFLVGLCGAALLSVRHCILIRSRDPGQCMAAFRSSHWIGFSIFAGLVASYSP